MLATVSDVDALPEPPSVVAEARPLRCYRVKEVAELLQVSPDTVRKEMTTGVLGHIVVGDRAHRIPHSALEARLRLAAREIE